MSRAVDRAKQSLLLGFIIACVLTGACLLFYKQIVAIAGFPANITGIAEVFIKVFAFALGPTYLFLISNAVFRAGAEMSKPLISTSI